MRTRTLLVCLALMLPGAWSHAGDVSVSPEYLRGMWSFDGKTGCGSSNARYVLFRANGTLEVGQGNQVQRVGFWKIVDNSIVANTLTAPNATEEYHPFFRDSYRYEYVAPRVVKMEPDSFAVEMGSDIEKEKRQVMLTRCQ